MASFSFLVISSWRKPPIIDILLLSPLSRSGQGGWRAKVGERGVGGGGRSCDRLGEFPVVSLSFACGLLYTWKPSSR